MTRLYITKTWGCITLLLLIRIKNLETMKNEIIEIAAFTCMVLVLGTQALLRGSWKVHGPLAAKVKSDNKLQV